jgi:hypothetical protein
MPDDKLTREQFAEKIKSKYPEYKDVDNNELVDRIIKKYPDYKDQVQEVKKKDSSDSSGSQLTGSESQQPSQSPSESQPVQTNDQPTNDQNVWNTDTPMPFDNQIQQAPPAAPKPKPPTAQELFTQKAITKAKEKWGETGTFKNYPTPDEKINNLNSQKSLLDEKYTNLIKANPHQDLKALSESYQKELDESANQYGLIKQGDRYVVPKNDLEKYSKHLNDAIQEVQNEEGLKDKSFLKSAFNALTAGAAGVGADISRVIESVIPYSNKLGLGDYYQQGQQIYAQKAKYFQDDIDVSLKEGNYGAASGKAALNIIEQVPLLISMAVGNEAGAGTQVIQGLALGEGIKKMEDIKDSDASQAAKIYSGIMSALNFVALGTIGGNQIINNAKKLITEQGEQQAKSLLEKSYGTLFTNSAETLAKATSPALRGYAIGASTQLSNNLVEQATTNPNKDIMEGVNEAGITWALMDKATSIYGDIQNAKQTLDVAIGKVPKNIPFDDIARATGMVLEKDYLTKQNESLDESFQTVNKNRIEDIKQKIEFITEPRVTKEKISLLNNEINTELTKENPNIEQVGKFQNELNTLEPKKAFPEDEQLKSLMKERDGLDPVEGKVRKAEIDKELIPLLKDRQELKQKFFDETIKGIDDPMDQDVYKSEKEQAKEELKDILKVPKKAKSENEIEEYVPGETEKVTNLVTDPESFQYKPDSDMDTGKTEGVKSDLPTEENPVTIWKDPETGEKNVIEGHNKFNAAKEAGMEDIPVKEIKAGSKEEALAKAAFENVKKGEMAGITKTEDGYRIDKTGTEFDKEGNLIKKPGTIGISHKAQVKRAGELGQEAPEPGEGVTKEEAITHGRDLISKGADPEKMVQDFKTDKKISYDNISAVRARLEELAKETNKAIDQFGEDSPEAKAAFEKEGNWRKEIKPMQTEWAKIGMSQQGETDIDTGSLMGLKRAFKDKTGKDFTPTQEKKAKDLSEKVKLLTNEVEELKNKLTEAVDKAIKDNQGNKDKGIKERSKAIAKTIRKGKLSRPGVFSAATPASLVWDTALEIAAKTIEIGGATAEAVAKGIADGIEYIKNSDWYKGTDKKDEAEKAFMEFMENSIPSDETKSIKRLEKQLEDLQLKKVKPSRNKREISAKEKELKEKIFEEKVKLGLVPSKTEIPVNKKIITEAEKFDKLTTQFVDKKGNDFSMDEVRDIWDYAKKEYLDKESSYKDMLSGVSKDLGLTSEQVRYAISQPKGARQITDEMYTKQNRRNTAISVAKNWVKEADSSKVKKFLKAIPSFFFGLKVFGHGTVGMITHSGTNIFKPSSWNTYWPNFFRQFKYAYGPTAGYEKAMEDLTLEPDFTFWKRAGLAVEPSKVYDDYQSFSKYFGRLGVAGDRGFNALKIYRYDLAKSIYDKLSNVEKSDPNTAKEIAKIVNHSTGSANVIIPKALNVAFFAPRLEAARWARLIVEPAKAVNTFVNWNKATPAQKAAAKVVTKRAGEMLGTYAALLAANQGLLTASGSKQSINVTDPTKSDWMKFKAGDKTIELTGGIVSTLTFIARMIENSVQSQKSMKGLDKNRLSRVEKIVGNYARGKFSPFLSTVTDFATQADFMGRPLPFSKDKPKSGEERYTWPEYLLEQQAPIPIAEGINETIQTMKDKGITEVHAKQILEGAFTFFVVGGTGARIKNETPQKTDEERLSEKLVKNFQTKHDPSGITGKGMFDKPTLEGYTEVVHKLDKVNTDANKKMSEMSYKDFKQYLKDNNLKDDLSYYKRNNSEISNLQKAITELKEIKKEKEKEKLAKYISKDMKRLSESYKNKEDFEISDEVRQIYDQYLESHKELDEEKKEISEED